MNKKEFTVFGMNMEIISIVYGIILITWGLIVTSISSSNSVTSLIPTIIGFLVFLLAVLALTLPKFKKLLMHIIVIVGLIIFLGGLDFLRGFGSDNGVFSNFWASISKLMMLITGFIFSFLCVRSFIFIRKNREH
ncbi:MAG: hypothetical protein OSB31_01255 [Paracoccaceae bacterium]|nr:hypothetical protein [Paracoccaceae bacterium]